VIERYIKESRNPISGSRAQMLNAIKNSDLGETSHPSRTREVSGCAANVPAKARRREEVEKTCRKAVQ
jgi:hypothetical protein